VQFTYIALSERLTMLMKRRNKHKQHKKKMGGF
jgi:hypothetical protein